MPTPSLDDIDRMETSRSRAEHRKNLAFASFLLALVLGGIIAFAVGRFGSSAGFKIMLGAIAYAFLVAIPLGLISGGLENARSKKLAAVARDGSLRSSSAATITPGSCIANLQVVDASDETLHCQRHGGILLLILENLCLFLIGSALLLGFVALWFKHGWRLPVSGAYNFQVTAMFYFLFVAGVALLWQAGRSRAYGWRVSASPPKLEVHRVRFLCFPNHRQLERSQLKHIALKAGNTLKAVAEAGRPIHLANLTPWGGERAASLADAFGPGIPSLAAWRARRLVVAINRVWSRAGGIELKDGAGA